MKVQKIFPVMVTIFTLTIAEQAFSDTTVNIQNPTPYCGQVLIQYGPAAHPTWNSNNLPFVPKASYEIGHINDINNFPDYVFGLIKLQSIPSCNGAHFSMPVNCVLNVKTLPDSFTVNVSLDATGHLICTAD